MGMFTEFVISTETLKIASQLSSLGLWQEHHNRLCPAFDAGVAKSERFSCLAVHDDSSFRLFKGAPAAPDLSVRHFSDGRELQRIELMKKKAAGQRRLAEHQKGLLEHQARSLKWAEAFERHAAIVERRLVREGHLPR